MTTMIDKRSLLRALLAVGALSATGAHARAADALAGVDAVAAADIGRVWLTMNPHATARALNAVLFPHGRGEAALQRLTGTVRSDFTDGKLFVYKGWRLSDTEGRICALIALA